MSTQNPHLKALHDAGVSIWLDDLSRGLIKSGELNNYINEKSITGVTTNPSIFQAALSHGDDYKEQIKELAQRDSDVDSAIRTVTSDDVRDACDAFAHIYQSTGGFDGRVSIEVDPRLAHDTQQTIVQAVELYKIVDRPNVLIKIPATKEGLPAITKVIAEGVSVNVTLIFSVERYKEVIKAYLDGLQQAQEAGHDLSKIHSVASFFISRVDTEIDNRLDKIGSDAAKNLRGKAGLANARLAYVEFQKVFESEDTFKELHDKYGANIQRPLWASTGTKNANYSDTLYVSNLVAPHTVNTAPAKTIAAFADHGETVEGSIVGKGEESAQVFKDLKDQGIDLNDVFKVLEDEGVDKFVDAWKELLEATDSELSSHK